MIKRRSGYIVGVSSMIAYYPMSTAVAYTTSKYAVKGFMDALARESQHEKWGVKTLTVFPHLTNTRKEMIDHVRSMVSYVLIFCIVWLSFLAQFEYSAYYSTFRSATLERVGMNKPIEIAKETVYALRTDAGYVTVPTYYMLVGKIYQ